MHRRSPDVPLADSVGAMADLVAAGKVRWLGLSAIDADELRVAHAIHPITAVQSEWSIFTRDIETAVIPAAAELGVTVVPYAPLGRGMLTGQGFAAALAAGDYRGQFPRFLPENRAANLRLVAGIENLAAMRGVTAAQLALAWLYARSRALAVDMVPIPGTRRRSRLEQNVAAASLALDDAAMTALAPLAIAVRGMPV